MMFRWPFRQYPRLDWLQVEVSSTCSAACVYCPHTLYSDAWQSRLMPVETFRRLAPMLSKIRLVYLQGWGEPFLHPSFFELVQIAKSAGCRVGATTNGMHLNEDVCNRIVEEDVDIIAFTLAGVDERNDEIRRGTRFEQVIDAMRTLNRIKYEHASTRPHIHIAYMLLRSGIDSLTLLPDTLSGLDIHQVTISTLDFVAGPEMVNETVIPDSPEEYSDLRSKLETVVESGKLNALDVHYYLAAPAADLGPRFPDSDLNIPLLSSPIDTCTENIHHAAFISADGRLSPCVFMNIPVVSATYLSDGREIHYHRQTYGDISTTPLDAIWRTKDYIAFRAGHRRSQLPDFCHNCPKHRIASTKP